MKCETLRSAPFRARAAETNEEAAPEPNSHDCVNVESAELYAPVKLARKGQYTSTKIDRAWQKKESQQRRKKEKGGEG